MFRLPSSLYFSACLGSLFLSILCTLIFPYVNYKILAVDLFVIVKIRTEHTNEFMIYIHMRFYTSKRIKRYVTRSIASFPSFSFFRIQRSFFQSTAKRIRNSHISVRFLHSHCQTISKMLFHACYMSIASHSPILSL